MFLFTFFFPFSTLKKVIYQENNNVKSYIQLLFALEWIKKVLFVAYLELLVLYT